MKAAPWIVAAIAVVALVANLGGDEPSQVRTSSTTVTAPRVAVSNADWPSEAAYATEMQAMSSDFVGILEDAADNSQAVANGRMSFDTYLNRTEGQLAQVDQINRRLAGTHAPQGLDPAHQIIIEAWIIQGEGFESIIAGMETFDPDLIARGAELTRQAGTMAREAAELVGAYTASR